ncbi:glycosyltransferase family 2 protein [Cerasicoccus fimbriatus]|uniref:glycosyltransferase family 2 protein n=1 Tax=Cerasicoccus fimbriatus TaxID=3014554 RepID=UPI0022B3AC26|nr:glycosyltransferase family 2 protein [Cerasicoccus sp. TK19100]
MNVSVIILTYNEEQDLPACLAALTEFEDVHVLDSGSRDQTKAIARKAGCHVSENPFQSFGQQRNYALENLPLKHDWILFLDADEIATPAFRQALHKAIDSAPEDVAGFYCCWKTMLDGRWLKRCDSFPKWQFRLLRQGRADFTDFGHGQKEGRVDGRLEYLHEPYEHYAFSKGWEQWFEKHDRYAKVEARARMQGSASWGDLFSGNGSRRNQAIKIKLGRSWVFPWLRFLVPYVLKFGFLEGKPGFTYCRNIAIYERTVYREVERLRRE